MRLIAFPQWDKLTSLLRGMARQSAADYAQRKGGGGLTPLVVRQESLAELIS